MKWQIFKDYNVQDVVTELSGLQNPNSVSRLSKWLQEETGEEVSDLKKGLSRIFWARPVIKKLSV